MCRLRVDEVSDYRYQGHIPRPDRIIVYDFAAVPSDLRRRSMSRGKASPHR
ncbi:MAG: hypothetical protein U1E38_08660 [Rhodospirillales bacterium]